MVLTFALTIKLPNFRVTILTSFSNVVVAIATVVVTAVDTVIASVVKEI